MDKGFQCFEADALSDNTLENLEKKMLSALLSSKRARVFDEVNILLAEDSEDDYFFISEALERSRLNSKLNRVRDGAQIIAYLDGLENDDELPDLVLLDINMPKINGHQVIKYIRSDARFKNLLIVMLTSSSSPRDIDRAYTSGANSYIVKDSNLHKFVKAFNSMKEFWFGTAVLPMY